MLRYLILEKRKENKTKLLNQLKEQLDELLKNEEQFSEEVESISTDEDANALEEKIAELEANKKELQDKMKEIEEEIEKIKGEQDEIEQEDTKEVNQEAPVERKEETKFMTRDYNFKDLSFRGQIAEVYRKDEEVRNYLENLKNHVQKRGDFVGFTGNEAIIPDNLITILYNKIGDYTVLKTLVNNVKLNGTGRVVVDGKIPEALWIEACDPLKKLDIDGFTQIELDQYKVGGYVSICRAFLEDSMIDFGAYVLDRLAMAIAKAIDKAILNGTGTKEPQGILPKVTTKRDFSNIKDMLLGVGSLDLGTDGIPNDKITAVMKRQTFYKYILGETYLPTATGSLVVASADGYKLPDGTPVVFSEYMEEDKVLIGDFKGGYILGERAGVRLEESNDVKFIEDQKVFKGVARYDGKVVNEKKFVLLTYKAPVVA